MSVSPIQWSPVLIGFTLSTFMYGTALGQSIYYIYTFPDDPNNIKALVLGIILADSAYLVGSIHFFWTFFVSCHRSNSWSCEHNLPWGEVVMGCINGTIIFIVQCFYCRRIWTISGQNKPLTFAIFVLAASALGSGAWYNIDFVRSGTIQYLYQCPLALPIAITDVVCDLLITSGIFKYMWKSGFRKRRSTIQDLAIVCINMGLFTCITSMITGIIFLVQGAGLWIGSSGMVVGQSKYRFPMPDSTMLILDDVGYVNSMLAVLNARKAIRDRDPNIYELSAI
ncbi:hypothetical protein J3R83DRAFT_2731 [Lanmaoa asiatica]|nr:hypothetical protein J3R83DRAFT_2731 [Lanmaoa asiatica]